MPTLIMLGTKDPTANWTGGRGKLPAAETVAWWCKANECKGESVKTELPDRDPNDGCRVHAQRWEGRAPVLFYTMEGHGHGWPMQRGGEDRTGPKTKDISAPEEFWTFFKYHER